MFVLFTSIIRFLVHDIGLLNSEHHMMRLQIKEAQYLSCWYVEEKVQRHDVLGNQCCYILEIIES